MIPTRRYVCTDCGAIKEWVCDPDDLRVLKRELTRVAGKLA
jgi:hypothetical protein